MINFKRMFSWFSGDSYFIKDREYPGMSKGGVGIKPTGKRPEDPKGQGGTKC